MSATRCVTVERFLCVPEMTVGEDDDTFVDAKKPSTERLADVEPLDARERNVHMLVPPGDPKTRFVDIDAHRAPRAQDRPCDRTNDQAEREGERDGDGRHRPLCDLAETAAAKNDADDEDEDVRVITRPHQKTWP